MTTPVQYTCTSDICTNNGKTQGKAYFIWPGRVIRCPVCGSKERLEHCVVNEVHMPPGITTETIEALTGIIRHITSGEHYETRNPYMRPAVVSALKALAKLKGLSESEWIDAAKATP